MKVKKWIVDPAKDLPVAVIEDTADGVCVCEIYAWRGARTKKNLRRAKLIAAAPELLAACLAVREGWARNLTVPMALINAAINKATL